ncbi:MAG: toxin-antitoxin system YwqK family antitoxin, partial [Bacteroidales bacterium]|nr:toxin-antitoxin system YwqK family antitoxin [Bacteroidales bacterium]
SKGKRTGKSWIYHRNGQLYMKGAYLNGEKTGMWIVFNEEGIVLTTTTF